MNRIPNLAERTRRVLAEEIGPALGMDGTHIELLEIKEGAARLRLNGACGNCPGSVMAVIMGIEQELRRLLPEIDYVEVEP